MNGETDPRPSAFSGQRLRIGDPFELRALLKRSAAKMAAAGDEDLDRVAAALAAIARADEPPTFEALLGIPPAWRGSDRERRDQLLRRAAHEFEVGRPAPSVAALHRTWQSFVGRIYPLWRDDPEPPPGASHLHSLLFRATKLNRGAALSLRQVRNVIRER